MPVPGEIARLIEKFRDNEGEYLRSTFVEMRARDEFIDPFFQALGWDVGDTKGLGPGRSEVVLEDTIRRGEHPSADIAEVVGKRPDYSFRIDGKRKFYVEAKKPSEDIERNKAHAFQVRAYGWSAGLPISILTDFQQLSVYDCRVRPDRNDEASTARLPGFYMTYDQYAERWDEIEALLHREAVAGGSLDKYVEQAGARRGTLTVDAAFLKEISEWRRLLAEDIARRNPGLSQRDLNYAVQMTINRIIFLRICEDRGIESLEWLKRAATRPSEATYREGHVYRELVGLFERADERYNSGLFHFHQEKDRHERPDAFTLGMQVGDDALTSIISHLYYPYPYKFDVIPIEILGQVYEQFLGKVIVKQPEGGVAVEDKPEVRKAGGVYYTPTYIVDYIVAQTVGKLVHGKTPDEVSKLRVLDPACGSGSFLIGAYQSLLDWHLDYYTTHAPEQYERIPRRKGGPLEKVSGVWRLTIDERKRILRNNIYGVDIDTQAVEVTKLSLLLKVLEGETESTLGVQTRLVGIERVLPDLADNIKAGNSLIGPDFYDTVQMGMFEEEEARRTNVFDWHEAFRQIMGAGGFDAVIGNPPYGADFLPSTLEYTKRVYETFVWRGESYLVFVEQAVRLLKTSGQFGFIIPDTYLNLEFTQVLRAFLLQNTKLSEIVLLPASVFPGATVDTTLLFFEKTEKADAFHDVMVSVKTFDKKAAITSVKEAKRQFHISSEMWHQHGAFNVHSNATELGLLNRVEAKSGRIADIAEMFYGIKAYQVGKGKPPQSEQIRDSKPFTSDRKENERFLPFYDGKHIGRYELLWKQNNWIDYGPWLAEPRTPEKYEGEKILIRKIVGETLIATYIPQTSYCNTLLFVLKVKPASSLDYHFVLGIINSHFIGWYFRKKFQISTEDTFPQIMIGNIMELPIPPLNKAQHDRMVQHVNTMLELHKRSQAANNPYDKETIERQIKHTDRQIDRLVYELYGLTEEEIAIVEGGQA